MLIQVANMILILPCRILQLRSKVLIFGSEDMSMSTKKEKNG